MIIQMSGGTGKIGVMAEEGRTCRAGWGFVEIRGALASCWLGRRRPGTGEPLPAVPIREGLKMEVYRYPLPGIGLRHEFVTERGRRVGVVSHHTGRRDVVIYDRRDPDTAEVTLTLTAEEADELADLLGYARVLERLGELHREVAGLVSEQMSIPAGSPYDGRSLGDTRARTRTGASIVAVVRGHEVLASPRPDFVFQASDVVVVIGTAEGTAAVAAILAEG